MPSLIIEYSVHGISLLSLYMIVYTHYFTRTCLQLLDIQQQYTSVQSEVHPVIGDDSCVPFVYKTNYLVLKFTTPCYSYSAGQTRYKFNLHYLTKLKKGVYYDSY